MKKNGWINCADRTLRTQVKCDGNLEEIGMKYTMKKIVPMERDHE